MMEVEDFVFKCPTTITISGSTGCGKTTLLKKILRNPNLFSIIPNRIIYCYGVWQESFNEMTGVEFRRGIDIPNLDITQHTILIFDDLMSEIVKSKTAEELFTLGSHHRNITVILLLQNLYQQGPFSKTIMLNVLYVILMNNSRDLQQIKYLGRQLGLEHTLEEAYKDCMKTRYGYLLVDLSPHNINSELRLKTHIFSDQDLIVYLPKL